MALSDKESDLNARVNLDGKEAKKTLTELQKLVENLNTLHFHHIVRLYLS